MKPIILLGVAIAGLLLIWVGFKLLKKALKLIILIVVALVLGALVYYRYL